jgi:hypothetical protein
MTAVLVLSGTSKCGTPPIASSARTWASIGLAPSTVRETPRNVACRDTSGKLQTNDLARLAHRNSLRWHRSLLGIAKGAILNRPAVELVAVPDTGRDHPIPVGGIIS